jgi:hypothetical protein
MEGWTEEYQQLRDQIGDLEGYPDELRRVIELWAFERMAEGRPKFGAPHAAGAARWAYDIAISEGMGVTVPVTAGYVHDVGYAGMFETVATLDQVMDKKALHMEVGARMVEEFLHSNVVGGMLTEEEKWEIVEIVGMHDRVDGVRTRNQQVVMEADSCSVIDTDWVKPTYVGDEALEYLRTRRVKRRERFVTDLGKRSWDELAERFEAFIRERDL